jgi:antitoxin VapB
MSQPERHVRLFRNGRNQALRIPREFELEGNDAIIRKECDRLIVEPIRKGRLLALLATLPALNESFPDSPRATACRHDLVLLANMEVRRHTDPCGTRSRGIHRCC